jgi:hypothetical protein
MNQKALGDRPLDRTKDAVDKSISLDKIQKCTKTIKNFSTIQIDICSDRKMCVLTCGLLLNLDKIRKRRNSTF